MRRRDVLRGGASALVGGAIGLHATETEAAVQFGGRGGAPGRRSDAWIGVDAANLTSNLALVKERVGGRPVMAVVKADAYGHGIVPVAQILAQAGADSFMVGNSQEAMALRLAGITEPILNFGPLFGGVELLIDNDIQQMIDSREVLSELVATAAQNQAEATVHLHIDTGLGRMGVPWSEAGELIEFVGGRSRVRIGGVSTAFSEDPEYDQVQLRRFLDICEAAAAAGIDIGHRHAASSAAVLAMPEAHLDMVRPGILLYGHYPSAGAARAEPELGLKPTMGIRVRIAQVKTLKQGDTVGYHRVYVAPEEQTIAVLPIGYSDGYPPEAVLGGGHVWAGSAACPFVGEMSANHCMVRIPEGADVAVGDFAVMLATGNEPAFFGRVPEGGDPWAGPPSAEMLAQWSGRSVYRVLIGMNPELPRSVEGARRR